MIQYPRQSVHGLFAHIWLIVYGFLWVCDILVSPRGPQDAGSSPLGLIITCLVADPYKPSFVIVIGKGCPYQGTPRPPPAISKVATIIGL